MESGTFAAASGGTTMIVDHVISTPDSLLDALALWEERAARQATIDYGFHMSITGWSEKLWSEMATVVDRGVNTFKHSWPNKGALMVNDDEMFASFTRCKELGAIPFVHAENGDIVAAQQAKLMAEGNSGPEAHAYSRPASVEGEATNRAIMIADAAGVPVYIVHTSSEDAHEAIRRARQNGQRVWGEPLVQHLISTTANTPTPTGTTPPSASCPRPSGTNAIRTASGWSCRRLAPRRRDRPLCLHHRAETGRPQ